MKLLHQISSLDNLKSLSIQQLESFATEIRELVINVISETGGHLSSSLGAVELILAIHHVFNAPEDKIIWDVGHQTYAHKIITGRRDSFSSIRKLEGLSGFPNIKESVYDAFGTGHSGTSISAALGMVVARDLSGKDYDVVAVIGDGAMSSGIAFEALNHAGHMKKDLIVILNNNEMSISKNVGALSQYLNKLITAHFYTRVREDIESVLTSIPPFGPQVLRAARRIEKGLKGMLIPGKIFEDLGFRYIGPIDGHNIGYLVDTLENVKFIKGPRLIHVVTKKGKGYEPAEKEPELFHSAGPFDVKTGRFQKTSQLSSYTEVFGKTLAELGSKDKKIVAITAAMSQGTGLHIFQKLHKERFFDVGIAEQHAVTFAAGLAIRGLKPVVAIYSTFLQRAFDEILHDVCLQDLAVVFAIDRAGIVGADGPTHHGLFDVSYLRIIPGITAMSPADENELRHMLFTAVSINRPVALRYPRGKGYGVPLDKELKMLPIGKAEVKMEGKDVAIIALGNCVMPSLEAASCLKRRHGISATVVNARFIKPMDTELLSSIFTSTGFVVTVEENVLSGGFGSAVMEMCENLGIKGITIKRIGIPDQFVSWGPTEHLRKVFGISDEGITETVLGMLKKET